MASKESVRSKSSRMSNRGKPKPKIEGGSISSEESDRS